MRISRLLVGMALPALMAGCSSIPGTTYQLDELRTTTPTGTPFTQALSREYLAFAQSERDQYDWMNSQYFAAKGLKAAHGEVVPPEALADWSFNDKQAEADLAASRDRLVGVLATNAPTRSPALTATAQVKFDCWVEQQDEGWQVEDIAACRNDFKAAMNALTTPAIPAPVVPTVPSAPPATVAPQRQSKLNHYQLFFDFDKDQLTPEAGTIVAELAKAAKASRFPKLKIVGYSDLSGGLSYNLALSKRRAERVRTALIVAGLPADRMSTEGKGKTDPLVATADGVREPQNRRVVVDFPE